jgi:hypothetical protein
MFDGFCQSPPPNVLELANNLDAAHSDGSIDLPDHANEPQELKDVDIDTFLASWGRDGR